jgi:hypothetical protein
MMEDNLLHNILELQERLKLSEQKLSIAIEGLRVISDNTDNYNVASKTLDEIDSI